MLSLGRRGERKAAWFLRRKGLRIIRRNYKCPSGEVDIIARDGDTLVFVEVKTRKDTSFGSPLEAVDSRKQKRITSAALFYMNDITDLPPVRFDVISIVINRWRSEVEHVRDAFELQ